MNNNIIKVGAIVCIVTGSGLAFSNLSGSNDHIPLLYHGAIIAFGFYMLLKKN